MSDTGQEPDDATCDAPTIGEISLFLMSEEGGAELVMRYGAAGVPAVEELLGLFGKKEGSTFSIDPVQVASPALKSALNILVTRHASATPHLHRLDTSNYRSIST